MKRVTGLTIPLLLTAALTACSGTGNGSEVTTAVDTTAETTTEAVAETTTVAETTAETVAETTAAKGQAYDLQTGQAFYAAHGTKSFAAATVVLDGETIVLAYIDEYQYLDAAVATGVPNSENFGDYVSEGYVLGSKRVNNESYSTNMAAAGSTVEIYDNFNIIQDFVAGKTITELEELVKGEKEAVVDAVSGATLVDTSGYIQAILAAAENAGGKDPVTYEGDLADLKINQLEGAAHGTKCFTLTTAVTDGKQIVAAYIDEFQYLSAETTTGVPNSENFTDYVAEGYVLGSKRVNAEAYSTNMAAAGSTVAIDVNYDMIGQYLSGKTVEELKVLEGKPAEEVIDAVSGATLTDTPGYIAEAVKAAETSK